MTNEEAINILNDYDINFERHTPEEVAEAHEMAIKALETQPSEDEKVIRLKKGTLKARTGRYVIYDVEWLKTHFNTTEAKIYGQPNERTEMHECDCANIEQIIRSTIKEYIDKDYSDKVDLLLSLNKDLCERIRKND